MRRTLPYQLTDNLFVLGHNLFLTYLIKGETCTLVDLGVSGTVPLIMSQLKQLGLQERDIGNLVVQHVHWDHVCGLPYLKQLSPGATVLGSAKAQELFGKSKVVEQLSQNDALHCSQLKERGIFHELPSFLQYHSLPIDQVVKDNETIKLGGVECCFLATPGHSPCSISVYLPSEKAVLVSDAIGAYSPRGDFYLPLYFQGVKLMLDSLEKIKSLDVHIVGYGHDTEMLFIGRKNISDCYERTREEIIKFTTEIKEMIALGEAEEKILDKIFRASFRSFLAEIYPPEYLKAVSPLLLKAIMNMD